MKKLLILSTALIALNAGEITNLFEAIKKAPESKIDSVAVKQMKTQKKEIIGSLFPKLNVFANTEHFSSPTSIKPMPPTVSQKIGAEKGGYWFSQNITKVGFLASMPLFVKEIYDNKDKISHLITAKEYQKKLNLLKREALLVTYLSKLNYLFSLKNALIQKENSINTTLKAIEVGVNAGSIPKFKLLRLKDALNQIKIKITDTYSAIDTTKAAIYQLTKIKITQPIKFETYNIKPKNFLALKPLEEVKKANEYALKAAKDKNYPSFMLKAQGYRAFAKAYNNDNHLAQNFASIGIYMNWNIFDKTKDANIENAQIQDIKSNLEIQKTLKDLNAQVMKINSSLKEIKKAINLTENSITLKEELLKDAKTAFEENSMTVDEYLTYEDNLADAKASLANLIATKNTLLANLAFIYGNNLERIFK